MYVSKPIEMTSRFVVTCFLCMWVFCISAPLAFSVQSEDASLMVSMGANEEEPGEPENSDGMEESQSLPETWRFCSVPCDSGSILPLENQVSRLEIVPEVSLPPPKGNPRT